MKDFGNNRFLNRFSSITGSYNRLIVDYENFRLMTALLFRPPLSLPPITTTLPLTHFENKKQFSRLKSIDILT